MDKDISLSTLASAILYALNNVQQEGTGSTRFPSSEAYTEFDNTIESYDLRPQVNGDGTVDINFYREVNDLRTCKDGDVFRKVWCVTMTMKVIEDKFEE